jgi:hypothetical protein
MIGPRHCGNCSLRTNLIRQHTPHQMRFSICIRSSCFSPIIPLRFGPTRFRPRYQVTLSLMSIAFLARIKNKLASVLPSHFPASAPRIWGNCTAASEAAHCFLHCNINVSGGHLLHHLCYCCYYCCRKPRGDIPVAFMNILEK